MYDGQEELDGLVWDKNDEDYAEAEKHMRLKTTCRQVERLVQEQFGKPAKLISPIIFGGFNIRYRIRLEDASEDSDMMVRLPCPSLVQFPDEKTIYEAATGSYIAKHTRLPIPRHLKFGKDPLTFSILMLKHPRWRVFGPMLQAAICSSPS